MTAAYPCPVCGQPVHYGAAHPHTLSVPGGPLGPAGTPRRRTTDKAASAAGAETLDETCDCPPGAYHLRSCDVVYWPSHMREEARLNPEWKHIFTREIIHTTECPYVEPDENGDYGEDCDCYVTRLWDALHEREEQATRG